MKLKGVNPIEQHIEKIVLAFTALVLLAVISMQFVATPNAVDTGSREVSPDQVYTELASSALGLQSQITDQSPTLPSIQPVDLVARYNNAFDSSDQVLTQLSAPLGQGIDIASVLGTTIQDRQGADFGSIAALQVPATSTPLASSIWGTLDPYAVIEAPAYQAFIPAAQPFDFPSVTIEADFSGTELRAVLDGQGDHPGIPRQFWTTTGMAIMGLDVERQQLLPDGSWSSSQAITTPPGTPSPTNAVTKDDGLVRLNQIIAAAQEVAPQVMRPEFPPTISGPDWQAPSDALDSGTLGLTESQQLQRQLARLSSELERLKNPTRQTASARPSGGKTASRGSRDPRTTPRGSSGASNALNDAKIDRLETQVESIKASLEQLGIDSNLASSNTDILDEEFIQLWTHDLGVTPGATYRYRTRAIVNNPYFRKGPYLDEEDPAQQALTVEPFSAGQWSQWSDPIAVGAREFFFVSEASQPVLGAQPPQARVELYSMYYGYYRRSSSNITPGELLAADMRVSGDLFLINTDAIDADGVAEYIQALNQDDPDSQRPDGLTDAPDRLAVNLNSFLIDISADPLAQPTDQNPQPLNLIFRLPDGSLVERDPFTDRNSTLYDQAQSSATKATRSQLRPTGRPAISDAAALFAPADP